EKLRLQRLLRRERRIDGRLLTGRRREQRLGARQRQIGILQLRLDLRDRPLLGLDVGAEGSLLQPIEEIARLDLGALREEPLVEEGGDARHEVDPVGRLDAADELARRRDRGSPDLDDADRRWLAGLLGVCRRSRGERHGEQKKMRGTQHRAAAFRESFYGTNRNGTVSFHYTPLQARRERSRR